MGSEQIRYGEEVDAGEGLRGTESSQTEEPEQERNLRKRGWGGQEETHESAVSQKLRKESVSSKEWSAVFDAT